MTRDNWYRRHTWTEIDQAEFFARLSKSRGAFNKAQYARIQAYELHHGGGKEYAAAALELLEMILAQWPADAQRASVHQQRAQCLHDLGDVTGMLAAYRATFEEQRKLPSWLTDAHEEFAWWVALSGRRDLFDEAIGALNDFARGLAFPASIYLTEGARALIHEMRGEPQRAATHARNALTAGAAEHSGFRNHPRLGLVKVQDKTVHDVLMRLASDRA